MNKREWWGYKHSNGSYQAKVYFGPKDISEAEESPFCVKAVGPFMAEDREDALSQVEALCNPKPKKSYEVIWKATILADSPQNAAIEAIDYIMVGGVRTFEVKEDLTGETELVDLSDPKIDETGEK